MNYPVTKTLLTLGCAGTLAATANAQLPTSYNAGDFLLGFREVGSANSVVVDIGSITSFNVPSTFTINAGATLTAQYGSGWQTNPNVYFSLTSTDPLDLTSYVTSPEYTSGLNVGPAQIWPRLSTPNSRVFQNKINALGSEFTSAYTTTGGEVEKNTDPNAYQNFMPGGTTDAGHAGPANIAWAFFNPTSEGNFGQGTNGVALDLIQLVPGSGPGNDLGFFQISANGNTLTYTPGAIPEPSSIAASVLGVLALFGFQLNKARKSSIKRQAA